jgi:UDP-N-acetyl-D-mannosaminuronic acid dehydrogenase
MPGKLLANLTNVSRVVGGMTPETAATMVALYKHIVQADLDPTDCITAELVKTTENAYRDVQIAFANEIALICEAVGGDVWKVRELVNKSPQRNMHLPGAGVGGHCIPKDPWLLAYSVQGMDFPLRLIPAARVINEAMPKHMVKLLSDALQEHNLEIANSRILILGYSYNADSDDIRNSPSEIVEKMLLAEGAEVVIHDPYVSKFQGDLIEKAVNCNAAVLMVTHSSYRQINLAQLNEVLKIPILVDGRNWIDSQLAKRVGLKYYGLGLAQSKSG